MADITNQVVKEKLTVINGNWVIEEFDGFVRLYHGKTMLLSTDQNGFVNVINTFFKYLEAHKKKAESKPKNNK